ncbi:cation:proton antiporter regulatory subunit [Nocardioides cheoyonin]|uniref:cation:proton antiporter regulatory subunit n=1 Tax=Nocardioides cheoyonin TaxID=3156615 RepID=UPI0032B46A45
MEVEEVKLPGVGLRHDFACFNGRRIGVVSLKNGARELIVYGAKDPDAVEVSIDLDPEEATVLAELLGAPRVVERLNRLREQVEGLATTGIPLSEESPYVGRTLGDAALRTRTGASVVAVVRGDDVTPSPTPDFRFRADDKIVVVGTNDGVRAAAEILNPS